MGTRERARPSVEGHLSKRQIAAKILDLGCAHRHARARVHLLTRQIVARTPRFEVCPWAHARARPSLDAPNSSYNRRFEVCPEARARSRASIIRSAK